MKRNIMEQERSSCVDGPRIGRLHCQIKETRIHRGLPEGIWERMSPKFNADRAEARLLRFCGLTHLQNQRKMAETKESQTLLL